MLSTKVEQRFTIPGYETIATPIDGEQFKLEFVNNLTGYVDHTKTTRVWAKWAPNTFNAIITQSVPFTK